MARYIDADKLTDKLEELQFNAPVMTPVMKIFNVIELVEDQPTADVAEVKHGRWITRKSIHNEEFYVCSICGTANDDIWRYCPNCGAKMDGRSEEDV